MSSKTLIGILAVLIIIVGAVYFFTTSSSPASTNTSLTKEEAIQAAITAHPELASYQTTSLPPSSVEATEATEGWDLGFIQRGSGLPGILQAECYHVSNSKQVTATGAFKRSGDAVVENIDFATCTAKDATAESPTPAIPSATPPTPMSARYGEVTLKINQTATFPDATVKPLSIEEDSRCPEDVQCIQAGTVRLKIEVKGKSGTNPSIIKLGEKFTTEGVAITLTEVKPVKNSKVQNVPADYLFTFSVVKQGTPTVNNPAGKCYIGGCSAQLCTDQPDIASTCEYTAKYACYKTATCERQSDGKCGWTETAELKACLANS